MLFRKVRCLLVLLFVILTHLLILAYINDYTEVPLKISVSANNFWSFLNENFNEKFITPFHNQKLEDEDMERMYLLSTEMNANVNQILVPEIYLSDNPPPLITYDPRLTSSLLLRFLGDRLTFDKDLKNLQIPYFDWSDYVDLSLLNELLINPDKAKCSDFDISTGSVDRDNRNEIIDPRYFCIDDFEIDDLLQQEEIDETKKFKIRQLKDKLSPGFHVFGYGGRSKKDMKIMHSKSYLYDFMPTPLSMVLLLPVEMDENGDQKSLSNALQININQEASGSKKLISSSLFKDFPRQEKDTNLDAKAQLDYFMEQLKSTDHKANQEINYTRHLSHDLFVDNSSEILASLLPYKDSLNLQERSYLNTLDMSLNTAYAHKYFFEAKISKQEYKNELGGHYDWRFFNGIVNFSPDQPPLLFSLIKAWLHFVNQYKLNTWIAHGTLLSWYWNGLAFPWDIDFDVQMPIQDLHSMCKTFNQSLVMDLGNDFGTQELRYSKYFLDCGSYISQRKRGNGNNNIDARFIDVNSGIYIDITGLAVTDTVSPTRYDKMLPFELRKNTKDETISDLQRNEHLKIYNCRNNHFQSLDDISPLRLSIYEGQLSYIPNNYKSMLTNEYQAKAMHFKKFNVFTFIEQYNLWVVTKEMILFVKNKYPESSVTLRKYRSNNVLGQQNPDALITKEFKSDDDYVQYLLEHKDLLFEFMITEKITKFHNEEMKLLNEGKLTEHLLFKDNKLNVSFKPFRHDFFTLRSHTEGKNFVRDNEQLLRDIEEWKKGGSKEPVEQQEVTEEIKEEVKEEQAQPQKEEPTEVVKDSQLASNGNQNQLPKLPPLPLQQEDQPDVPDKPVPPQPLQPLKHKIQPL